jgi:UDP-N-acetylglucosamine/UDP-N-acetyl-alpha-D-glucosaminouronate 4-epimerase
LVTGGAGFIGSNMVDELIRRGHEVTVLDDLSSGKKANLELVAGQVRFILGTITNLDTVKRACEGADYVLHLAARTSVPRSVKDPIETNQVNIDGTLNVLVAARDAKVRRFVYAASSAAYGESPTLPKVETMQAEPISPYGVTKYVGELYARVFGKVYGLEFACVRYFNVFGPRQDPTSTYSGVLSKFMLAVLQGHSPVIYGDGEQSRDFTYIENVVEQTLRAAETPEASGVVLNGGTGASITLNEVVRQLGELTGRKIVANYEPPREGDIRDSLADISLAKQTLGYEPRVQFREGLRRTWEWYQQHYSTPE